MSHQVGGVGVSNVNTTYNQEVNNKVDTTNLPSELQNAQKSGSKLGLALKITATILTGGLFGLGWGIYSLVKHCTKSSAQPANQQVQPDNGRVSQNNNVNVIEEKPKEDEAPDYIQTFEKLKFKQMYVLANDLDSAQSSDYLNACVSEDLKNSLKSIVDDAYARNPDAVKDLIISSFKLLNIKEQVAGFSEEQLKNVLVCCVLGNRDNSNNAFSCDRTSKETFIDSVKSLFDHYIKPAAPEEGEIPANN
jgi:hypothetical protein